MLDMAGHRRRGRRGAGGRRARRCLSCVLAGQTCVVAFEDLPPDLAQKLFLMGLGKEGVVEVVAGGDHAPFLIRTRETRIMLDWDTVSRIPIKE